MKLSIDIPDFQKFLDNYRYTFQQKYKSPFAKQDSFRISYEQLRNENYFDQDIAPKLWDFLGISSDASVRRLDEVKKQSPDNEVLRNVINNYDELRYAFCHTDVSQFRALLPMEAPCSPIRFVETTGNDIGTWSILLPVCSREKVVSSIASNNYDNKNRFSDLEWLSKYENQILINPELCWKVRHLLLMPIFMSYIMLLNQLDPISSV